MTLIGRRTLIDLARHMIPARLYFVLAGILVTGAIALPYAADLTAKMATLTGAMWTAAPMVLAYGALVQFASRADRAITDIGVWLRPEPPLPPQIVGRCPDCFGPITRRGDVVDCAGTCTQRTRGRT